MAKNLGKLGDAIYKKAAEITKLNEKLKELDGEKRAMETELLQAMQEAGTDIVRGDLATVSISETERANIHDFESFERFVLRKKALHLFERRIAMKPYREMKEQLGNKPIPGVTEFLQTRLNVRKV